MKPEVSSRCSWYHSSGLPLAGSRLLGVSSVSGYRRMPRPPAKITAWNSAMVVAALGIAGKWPCILVAIPSEWYGVPVYWFWPIKRRYQRAPLEDRHCYGGMSDSDEVRVRVGVGG